MPSVVRLSFQYINSMFMLPQSLLCMQEAMCHDTFQLDSRLTSYSSEPFQVLLAYTHPLPWVDTSANVA